MKKISILSVICMSLLAMNVSAKDIYVSQAAANNTGDGSPTNPYKDLSYVTIKANTVIANGDVVIIVGTYDLSADPMYQNLGGNINDTGLQITNGIFDGNWDLTIKGYDANAKFTTNGNGRGLDLRGLGGQIYIKDLTFDNCGAANINQVGALWLLNSGPATNAKWIQVENCIFKNNKSQRDILRIQNSCAKIIGCTFEDNTGGTGNPGSIIGVTGNYTGAGDVTNTKKTWISDCDFIDNQNIATNTNNGGGLFIENISEMSIENSTFDGNSSAGQGGAVYIANKIGTITFDGITFNNNTSANHGGAVVIRSATIDAGAVISFTDCAFTGNHTTTGGKTGGAVLVKDNSGDITFTACTFDGNYLTTNGAGGAFAVDANGGVNQTMNILVSKSLFVNNDSGIGDGGAFNYANQSGGKDGASQNIANLTFVNTTFYNNIAQGNGGSGGAFGECYRTGSTFSLINCTMTGNKNRGVNLAGGIRFTTNSDRLQKKIYNCIIEGNYNQVNDIMLDVSVQGSTTEIASGGQYFNLDVQNSYIGNFGSDLIVKNPSGAHANGKDFITLPATNTAWYSSGVNINPAAGLPGVSAQAGYVTNYGILPLVNATGAQAAALTKGDATLLPAGITTDQLGYTRATPACTAGAVEMFTVSFETNGGTPPIDAQVLWGGAKVVEPSEPASGGTDTFGGWYSNIGLTALWDFDTDEVDGPLTLYAKWDAATGLTTATAGKTAVSVSYYDLTGKPVPADTKGFVIKRTVYEDGSIGNSKAIIK